MRRFLLIGGLLMVSVAAYGQGCTQCRDNSAAMPDQTKAAYRHAIALLVVAASGVFVGTVLLMRGSRRG